MRKLIIPSNRYFIFAYSHSTFAPVKGKVNPKQVLAEKLFVSGNYLQKEVAALVGITEKTMGEWVKKYGWKDRRASFISTRENQIHMLLMQINNIQEQILSREPENRFANNKESDSLAKLSTTMKNLEVELGISDMISCGIRFIDYAKGVDFEKGKELGLLFDSFLSTLIR